MSASLCRGFAHLSRSFYFFFIDWRQRGGSNLHVFFIIIYAFCCCCCKGSVRTLLNLLPCVRRILLCVHNGIPLKSLVSVWMRNFYGESCPICSIQDFSQQTHRDVEAVRSELRSPNERKTQPQNADIQLSALGVIVLQSAPGIGGISCVNSNDFNTN